MIIIDIENLNVSVNKLKYYYNEELLLIESLQKMFNSKNNMYVSNNLAKIKEYENNLVINLKTVSKNHGRDIEVFLNNINKYRMLEKKTSLIFENLGDKK